MKIFLSLKAQKTDAQQHRHTEPEFQLFALTLIQGVMGQREGDTGSDQQHGIE